MAVETQHGNTAHTDGKWGEAPVQVRSARFKSSDVNDFPELTGRELEWRYTPVARVTSLLGKLDGGHYDYELSGIDSDHVSWIPRTDKLVGSSEGIPEDKVSANAWTHFKDALHIDVPAGFVGTEPIIIKRDSLGNAPRAAHIVITAGTGSKALVVIDNLGSAQLAENVEIDVADDANLTVVSIQDWQQTAIHHSSHWMRLGNKSRLKHILVSLGGDFARLLPTVKFAAEGGDVELWGLTFADAGQHLEQQVFVDHAARNCKSRVAYKSALQGTDAHTVWIGDVLIRDLAFGTDSYELNRNLLLTKNSRADSVPNLEIETGDIVGAGHASATGRFDDEQLFYLQARGISEHDARRLVVFGFLMEIVQEVGDPSIESRLESTLEHELAKQVI